MNSIAAAGRRDSDTFRQRCLQLLNLNLRYLYREAVAAAGRCAVVKEIFPENYYKISRRRFFTFDGTTTA